MEVQERDYACLMIMMYSSCIRCLASSSVFSLLLFDCPEIFVSSA